MRNGVVLAVFLCGCGGFLPFFGDDDEPAPPANSIADGGADGADGADGANASDATAEASNELGAWRCFTAVDAGAPPYATQTECDQGRLGQCGATEPPATGDPCDRVVDEPQTACTPCMKTSLGGPYGFTTTVCTCR